MERASSSEGTGARGGSGPSSGTGVTCRTGVTRVCNTGPESEPVPLDPGLDHGLDALGDDDDIQGPSQQDVVYLLQEMMSYEGTQRKVTRTV
jgi:hypothetical protein